MSTILRRVVPATVTALGDNQCRIRMSTAQRARDGHILLPDGCDLAAYRENPIVLWSHDVGEPVGTNSEITVDGTGIEALCTFAPDGISATADKVRGLVKAGIVRAVSIGFLIHAGDPIDPARPRAGLRATEWELLECSFVTVPSDTGALVTERAMADGEWKVGAARDLPIEDSDEWDGGAAAESIFEYAGGDEFDPAKARKGFLVYDAAADDKRGSYKLPIARAVDGELKVPKSAIRAAASRLPQTDIPDATREAAQAVLDHYKKEAGMDTTEEGGDGERGTKIPRRAITALRKRMITDAGADPGQVKATLVARGLDTVAALAWTMMQLGWLHADTVWEAEAEGDSSPVPAVLGEALQTVGKALTMMTAEEVSEMLDAKGLVDEAGDDLLPAEERAFVRAVPAGRRRAMRRGMARMRLRAGRVLSQGNAAKLADAADHAEKGAARVKDASGHHAAMGDAHDEMQNAHARAVTAHEKAGDALQAADDADGDEAKQHVARALTHHRAMGKHLDAMGDRAATMSDAHADMGACMDGAGRSMKAAVRCVRSVIDGATDDSDNKAVQTSDGIDETGGATGNRMALDKAARIRRMVALELAQSA